MKKYLAASLVCSCLLACNAAIAHEPEHHPKTAVNMDVPDNSILAVAAVDSFAKALKTQDFKTIQSSLDPSVIVLEMGGAERSREEYMGHHAIADALFMAKAEVTLLRRTARVDGNSAWVSSETETRMNDGSKDVVPGTETMILNNTPEGWKIVHIHWSSRPKH